MKLQFEKLEPETGSSFRFAHHTEPNACWVHWHYHPEYEIVYIPGGTGPRQVGTHRSRYEAGELIFIGPNVPHLDFSHGCVEGYEEIVVQLRDDFLGETFLQRPELSAVRRLFEQAHRGLTFGTQTRQQVAPLLVDMIEQSPFDRLLTLLRVLQVLACAADGEWLHTDGIQFAINPKEQERINRVCHYVEQHFESPVDVRVVADLVNLSVPAFCRYFKRMTRLTFTDFVNEYRVNQARHLLQSARPISDIGFAVGFNNLSHFNKTFREVTGQTPSAYRKALI
ncbi:AraC family transcriptional regulator [Spirosoma sp. KUDC1026]|uniref:AraC family transcriptional regulator n=1 Tax=Spirosoma sp. KUDC1026 TaxID=2745947 RepID=UPI00159BCE26|nr:AraC family transcriptional regulator [Spirosoma sp. KUDC1026]QKZ15285.1 helix-turn-helix transcriptional regulator [Spirosoma sp. KUDC1026]